MTCWRSISPRPQGSELIYDQAMLAEKLGGWMKWSLLRGVMAAKRIAITLQRAEIFACRSKYALAGQKLIQKALEFAPGTPSSQIAWAGPSSHGQQG